MTFFFAMLLSPVLFYVSVGWAAFYLLSKAEGWKQVAFGLFKTAFLGTILAAVYLILLAALISGRSDSFGAMPDLEKASYLFELAFLDMSTVFYFAYILLGITQFRMVGRISKGGDLQ